MGQRLVRLSVALPAPPLLRKAQRDQAVTAITTMAVKTLHWLDLNQYYCGLDGSRAASR
jgi:hypothetical protein